MPIHLQGDVTPIGSTLEDFPILEAGGYVSLNLNKNGFFGLPDRSFFLTIKKPTARVPSSIPQAHMDMIQSAVKAGLLVLGQVPVQPRIKTRQYEALYDDLAKAETLADLKLIVFAIAGRRRSIPGSSPSMVLRSLIVRESETLSRGIFINFIADVMSQVEGHSAVEDHPQDRLAVGLRQTPEGKIVTPSPNSEADRKKRIQALLT